MQKFLLVLFMVATSLAMSAKDITVTGVVYGSDDETLPGVSVIVKGTAQGAATDIDGNFSVTCAEDAILQFSYVGYNTQELRVNGNAGPHKVVMAVNSTTLDDVVVIGYGVQKKSVVTASIARVSADDLEKVAPVRVDDALKGLAAGINVTSNSGQPGAGSTIRIRGIGTVNDSNPVYVVDGMQVNDIAFLNPNDIQSIEVLKDAASAAVYGTRGANGVILVTTKNGKEGRTNVTYDFTYSLQNPWRKRDVLNATEYAIMMNEGQLNGGQAPIYADPYSFGEGTDWQEEIFNDNAPKQNHQITISGGSKKVDYYLSLQYYDAEGIIGGDWDRSNYSRISTRANVTAHLFDESAKRNWLNKMDVQAFMNYSHENSRGISTNSEYGSVLGSAVALSPILNVYYTKEEEAAVLESFKNNADFTPVYSSRNGLLYTIPGTNYNEMTNPVAQLEIPNTKYWTDKLVGNWSAELQLIDNLKFKSAFGLVQAWYGNDSWTPKYYLNALGNKATYSSVSSNMYRSTEWQIENTLFWQHQFGKHDVSVLLGQSARKETGRSVGASGQDMLEESDEKANIDATTGLVADGKKNGWGGAWDEHTLTSLFGRATYNYDERYMLQFIIRRDGSSRFGANNRYATFPSLSLGWNLTNEPYFQKRPEWLTTTKVRFSWGKNGNEAIGNFMYAAWTATGNNAVFGNGASAGVVSGIKPDRIANPDLQWEESEQTDIGVDFGFFNNQLTFTVDYFKKKTNGMLMTMPIPGYTGEVAPLGNVGSMENSGLEFEIGYNWNVGDWNFHVGANASYLKNKLLNLGNASGYMTVESAQGLGEMVRATNGYCYPYFYGYKSNGIFQNQAEIDAYVNADGNKIQPDAVPGDVRWTDVNGDGQITAADQDKIGKGTPDWTYGFNIGVNWKDWDFSMVCQGVAGNDIFDASRRTDITSANLPSWMLNRWTGEGTSNKYPRYSSYDTNNWNRSSDLYLTDGSYFRIKNITLGYTLPTEMTKKVFVQKLRVFVAAENLLTLTKYAGFDPEISSGNSLGVDRGIYPQSRVWSFGVNLQF